MSQRAAKRTDGNRAATPAKTKVPTDDDGTSCKPTASAPPDLSASFPLKRAATFGIGDLKGVSSMNLRRHSMVHIPMPDGSRGHAFDLTDLKPLRASNRRVLRRQNASAFGSAVEDVLPTPAKIHNMMVRARTRTDFQLLAEEAEAEEKKGTPAYIYSAALAIVLNVLSVLPYVKLLAVDPGSPVFISFVTHLFVVSVNIHKAPNLFLNRQLPVHYHVAFVALAYAFNFLKSDSFSRLPTAVAMVMMNLQMLVGMVVQGLIFKQRFSLPQVSGCAIVTLGVIMAGISARKPSAASSSSTTDSDQGLDFLIGTVELLGGLTAVVFLSHLTKKAFADFGECVDEQIFFQHLFGLPLFFVGTQWAKIGPRISEWVAGGDVLMLGMLLSNLAFTFAGSKARVTFVGRAPNGLLVQLVETLTKFISLFSTALINAPPLPPVGFWAGSGTLILGTLQFLTASDSPDREDEQSESEQDK